jgi:hypothetical protein
VWTSGGDEAALGEGSRDAYFKKNLRYSQLAPISMFEEKNTKNNMPAQIELYRRRRRLQVPVHGQGRRIGQQDLPVSRNPSLLTHDRMIDFLKEKILTLGHRGLPALSPGDRHRRHLGGNEPEDGEATPQPAISTTCRPKAPKPATRSAISRWRKRSTS